MSKTLIPLLLILSLAGCYAPVGQPDAVRCAKNWARQGFEFDPNHMTCSQMWDRVQAIRRAAYWKEKGYSVDPNSMTWQQIDEKIHNIRHAQQWKERGYDFNPNAMTALEMDRRVQQLKEVQYWTELGYYCDPATQIAYVDKDKKIPLRSLPTPTSSGYLPCYSSSSWSSLGSSSAYSYQPSSTHSFPSIGVAENGSYHGQISENTGRPKTTYVRGYFRKDGTYVRSHYRSK